jgi:hypothetical protein
VTPPVIQADFPASRAAIVCDSLSFSDAWFPFLLLARRRTRDWKQGSKVCQDVQCRVSLRDRTQISFAAERLESVLRSCDRRSDADGDGHLPSVPRADLMCLEPSGSNADSTSFLQVQSCNLSVDSVPTEISNTFYGSGAMG